MGWAEYAKLAGLPWRRGGPGLPLPPVEVSEPQDRAQLCVLSALCESLASYLPAPLPVCWPVLPVWESLYEVQRPASCHCGPLTASSPGRKQ